MAARRTDAGSGPPPRRADAHEPLPVAPAAAGSADHDLTPMLDGTDLQVWTGLLRIQTRLFRRLDADLVARHGMPLVEYEVLFTLLRAGGALRMSELAERAMLSRSGLTRVVDVLVAQRAVRREPSDGDGRVLVATLTTAGRARVQDARRTHSANVRRLLLDPMSPTQKRAVAAAWTAVLAAIEADGVAGSPPDGPSATSS